MYEPRRSWNSATELSVLPRMAMPQWAVVDSTGKIVGYFNEHIHAVLFARSLDELSTPAPVQLELPLTP